MKQNQRGIASIVLILIIVGLIGVVGWFAFQNGQLKKGSITTPDSTAGWETYVNEEYGYTLKHPKRAKIRTELPNKEDSRVSFQKSLVIGIDTKYEEGYVKNLSDGTQIKINTFSVEDNVSPKELLGRHVNITAHNINTQTISNHEAATVKFEFPDWNQYTEIIRDNINYEFNIAVKGDNQENKLKIANKIISTFKFID